MPVVACPVEGFEHVTVAYPDRWTIMHSDKFWLGKQEAPDNASPGTVELFGTIALCDRIEGLDLALDTDNIMGLDLSYQTFFIWLRAEVYGSYLKAISPPKNSSGPLQNGVTASKKKRRAPSKPIGSVPAGA